MSVFGTANLNAELHTLEVGSSLQTYLSCMVGIQKKNKLLRLAKLTLFSSGTNKMPTSCYDEFIYVLFRMICILNRLLLELK